MGLVDVIKALSTVLNRAIKVFKASGGPQGGIWCVVVQCGGLGGEIRWVATCEYIHCSQSKNSVDMHFLIHHTPPNITSPYLTSHHIESHHLNSLLNTKRNVQNF